MEHGWATTPRLSRRLFLQAGLASISGYSLLPMVRPINVQAAEAVKLRGEAEFCIFVFLGGAPSQLDTFDLKEGRWTPPDFDIRTTQHGMKLPYGLFPRIAEQLDQWAIVRSIEAWESSHARAQYYLQAGHPPSAARQKEIPSIGAVVAHEFESKRRPSDFLPPYVAMNFGDGMLVREGFFPHQSGPVPINTTRSVPFVVLPEEKRAFDRRWSLLRRMKELHSTSQGPGTSTGLLDQFGSFSETAFDLMSSPRLPEIFKLEEGEREQYGKSSLGDACILARNLIQADAGTRYISILQGGWDLHSNMFKESAKVNHYTLCRDLDNSLSALLPDLAGRKSKDGKALLDKTFIVVMGEFGRTGGELTVNQGRDHNRMAQIALFAGAGVQGGQVIGETDDKGWKIVKPGWGKPRSIYTEDVVATIYSQLGIDWTKKVTGAPSGRAFEYLEGISSTDFIDISEMSVLFG